MPHRLQFLHRHLAVLFARTITPCAAFISLLPPLLYHINQWSHTITTIPWLSHFPNYSFPLVLCYSVPMCSHISDIATCIERAKFSAQFCWKKTQHTCKCGYLKAASICSVQYVSLGNMDVSATGPSWLFRDMAAAASSLGATGAPPWFTDEPCRLCVALTWEPALDIRRREPTCLKIRVFQMSKQRHKRQ